MHTFSIVALTIVSIVLIIVVLMQPSKTNGLSGFMGGSSETFYSKNRTRTSESMLSRITVISSVLFAAIVLAQNLLAK
ncbi:preprotein translocase subunit SecG [Clostridium sp. Marseille-Q2269]|uniref:preprotein translocase subunit SecG n=1 Tax=Clostridium sp. Marseille-Q2269 TaxID=2942205 RepID=UPI002074368B|nr:preprotein translocase subunit SecG [Clostridium sp. Marseille-Q2269]